VYGVDPRQRGGFGTKEGLTTMLIGVFVCKSGLFSEARRFAGWLRRINE
jgi:hypothetical protein